VDLLLVVVASVVAVPLAIFWGGNEASLVLGLVFALFSPGYSLVAALFPRRDDLDIARRLALGFGLSIVVVVLVGFLLNYTPMGISLYNVLIWLLVFIMAASGVAYYRRHRLPEEERFEPRFNCSLAGFRGRQHLGDRLLLALLALVIIGAIGTLVYIGRPPAVEQTFTEFYMLGPEGKAADYPDVISLGEEASVTLGIINHEQETTDYYIRIVIGEQEVGEVGTITLSDGEKWQQRVGFVPVEVGEAQKVEFQLYRVYDSRAYHTLDLWVDVVGNQ
jgi:uncharacterized membrane protein